MTKQNPSQASEAVQDSTLARRLFTLSKFAERHSSFITLPAITNQVFKAKARQSSKGEIRGNGMEQAGAIVRLAGRVLIDEDAYFRWVDSQQSKGQM